MRKKNIRTVLCVTIYPQEGPSVYHRIKAYEPFYSEQGYRLTIVSFLTTGFYHSRKNFGLLATLHKVLLFLFCTLRLMVNILRVPFYDVVVIHREAFPLGPSFFEQVIVRLNSNSWYDIDDAVWLSPSNEINQRALLWSPGRVAHIMQRCKGVVTGSPFIANYAKQFNDNVSIIPTPYDDLKGGNRKTKNEKPVVVWIGNVGNAYYLNHIKTALEKSYKQYPFVLRLIGGEDIRNFQSAILEIETIPWSREQEGILLCSSNIGIMPLTNERYEQGKCAFKLIQYMSAGLPVIASPVGMNQSVVTPEHGRLAENETEWQQALVELLGNAVLRQKMGQAGYKKFELEFTRKSNAERWIALWEQD